jgi:hypothetical protein
MQSSEIMRVFIGFFQDYSKAVSAAKNTSGVKKGGYGINQVKGNNSFIIKSTFKNLAFGNITITSETASELSVGNEKGMSVTKMDWVLSFNLSSLGEKAWK